MGMVGIYKITNLITNDCYIGQSRNLKKRINNHHQKGIHSKLFEEHISEYGWGHFQVEILEECKVEDLLEREAYYIDLFHPTYNTIVRGRNVPQETRDKISKTLTGMKQSEETKAKRRESIRKRHETIPQLNLGHRKKCASDEQVFESVKALAEHYGITPSAATQALKRGNKIRGHKVWYVV